MDAARNEDSPPAVVFDCMIFLQGLIRERGPAVACMELFETGRVRLLVSQEVLDEVRDVLTRPKLYNRFPRLTSQRVAALTQVLTERAEFVRDVPSQVRLERDPKDEKYLNLALAGGAQYLVTRDNDLLDLRDEQRLEGPEFRRWLPELKIVDPVEFLYQFRSEDQQ